MDNLKECVICTFTDSQETLKDTPDGWMHSECLEGQDVEVNSCEYCSKKAMRKVSIRIAEDSQDAEAGGIPANVWLCKEHYMEYQNHEGLFEPQY